MLGFDACGWKVGGWANSELEQANSSRTKLKRSRTRVVNAFAWMTLRRREGEHWAGSCFSWTFVDFK